MPTHRVRRDIERQYGGNQVKGRGKGAGARALRGRRRRDIHDAALADLTNTLHAALAKGLVE